LLFTVAQVSQATLPFGSGQAAMVIDPRTGCPLAAYKQILRVRLLLNSTDIVGVSSPRVRTDGL
jgi:hypothetical protein